MQGESADVEDSTKEAIDFMGASFRRNTQRNREESVARYESMIELDLSLRRPNTCENQSSGNRPSLHPSSASAFTRYVHRPQCSVSPLVSNQRKNVAASEHDNIVLNNQHNSSEPLPSAPRRNEASFNNRGDSSQMNSWPRQGSYPTLVPINSIQFNTAYASAMAPASLSPGPSHTDPTQLNFGFV